MASYFSYNSSYHTKLAKSSKIKVIFIFGITLWNNTLMYLILTIILVITKLANSSKIKVIFSFDITH